MVLYPSACGVIKTGLTEGTESKVCHIINSLATAYKDSDDLLRAYHKWGFPLRSWANEIRGIRILCTKVLRQIFTLGRLCGHMYPQNETWSDQLALRNIVETDK